MNKIINKIKKFLTKGSILVEPYVPRSKPVKRPRWRLKPDERGSYFLQEWNPELEMYLTEVVNVTPDDAPRIIANRERDHIYVGAE